jgi:HEAT repeat protein
MTRLRSRRWEARREAARKLADPNHEAATEALIATLTDEVSLVRHAAAEALVGMRLKTAPPALIGALKDKSAAVRLAAAKAIKPTGDVKALSGLIQAIQDPDREVRRVAVEALVGVKHPRAAKALAAALTNAASNKPAKSPPAPAAETGRRITDAIDKLGDAVEQLRGDLQGCQRLIEKQSRQLKRLAKRVK